MASLTKGQAIVEFLASVQNSLAGSDVGDQGKSSEGKKAALKKAIDIEPQSWYATEDAKRGALITGGSGLTGGLAGAALSGKGRRLKGAATGAGAGMGLAALALLTERYLNKE